MVCKIYSNLGINTWLFIYTKWLAVAFFFSNLHMNSPMICFIFFLIFATSFLVCRKVPRNRNSCSFLFALTNAFPYSICLSTVGSFEFNTINCDLLPLISIPFSKKNCSANWVVCLSWSFELAIHVVLSAYARTDCLMAFGFLIPNRLSTCAGTFTL